MWKIASQAEMLDKKALPRPCAQLSTYTTAAHAMNLSLVRALDKAGNINNVEESRDDTTESEKGSCHHHITSRA
jgi:hypothetical protein